MPYPVLLFGQKLLNLCEGCPLPLAIPKTLGLIVLHAQSASSIMTLSAATRPSPEGKSGALHNF